MMNLPRDLVDLESCPSVEIWDILVRIREFYRLVDVDEEEPDEARVRSIKARRALDSARLLVRNLLDPEHNAYIKEEKKSYDWMIDNIGRADKRLDEVEEKTIGQLENARVISTKMGVTARLTIYQKTLYEYMEHLVYFPLKYSYKRFILFKGEKDGKRIKKDSKLFLYFVFLYLFHASEMLGAITREEVKGVPRKFGVTAGMQPTGGEEAPTPSEIPKNPELEIALKELNKGIPKEETEGEESEEEHEEEPEEQSGEEEHESDTMDSE